MRKEEKTEIVKKLQQELGEINSVFLCNFSGLSVGKDTQLRGKIRECGASYTVVKNTLLKLAFADSDFAQINDHLVGNTALAHNREDLIGLAKLIRDFSKENKTFRFKAGVIEGKVIDLAQLDVIADTPPQDVLVAKLMFMLNYPVQGLVTTLSGVMGKLAIALDQIKQQKEQN